ncbi:hypothetical protein R1sor_006137 [Riccia sorocarpa]|uniref:Transposase n=1 Tax=Riccia sorocarpa TaxID=122646 RepID=A0ABD3HQS6_9MARC
MRSTGPEVSRSTSYRDARAVAGAVNRSFNFRMEYDSYHTDDRVPTDEQFPADNTGGHARAPASPIRPYNPILDEVIYRSTWKCQALLDTNNVSIDLQETILTILFSSDVPDMVENRQPDYRGMNLGSLLRYAGRDWREGELGLRGLCTLNGISRLYRNQGMPTVSRWKLCLGEGDSAHEPRAYAASRQDNYTTTGLKCNCNNRPSSGLQRDCDLCTERCEFTPCLLPRKQMESFDYIPIGAMVRMICMSQSFCHSMLAMWRAKHKWFRHDETELAPSFPIKDWWDGSKAKEISWFWDSDISWELPVVCMACPEVYQAFPVKCQELLANFDLPSRRYNFICKSCGTRGDPRNIPLLAHWDGFQSASTVFRSTWTVETKILSAGSNSQLPPMPVLFIPNTKGDTSSKSEALNVCLRPFIAELIDLYVKGVEVEYNYPPQLIGERELRKTFNLRVILVLFTGDHPAQCKFGGFTTSGYSACRRCKMVSNLHHGPNARPGGVLVYDSNRVQYHHPPERKTVAELRQAVNDLNACTTTAARKQVSQRTGVTRDSQVWKLYDLYGFDPSQDLTYDAMHVLALSMFKKYTELLKKETRNEHLQDATLLSPA